MNGEGVGSGNGGGVVSGGGGGVVSGGGGGVVSGSGGGVVSFEAAIPDPSMRRGDLVALHPIMREAVAELLKNFQSEELPFRVYEAFRSPVRQAWLYDQGRTPARPGAVVTYAQAWDSYHQYGLAVDFVLWLNGAWSWNSLGINVGRWERLQALGKKVGLETLKFETPHLQVAGMLIEDLRKGKFPGDGDDSWRNNLEGAIISWSGTPPSPSIASLRPAIPPSAS
jgi:peptidoglycan L-alanyl-D-glutamate endopeptidase CwlK